MYNQNQVILKKIPVDKLIDLLIKMYNKGVDYVDISGVLGKEQDKIAITFTKDYITKDCCEAKTTHKEDGEVLEDILKNSKLSEEDLNDLI